MPRTILALLVWILAVTFGAHAQAACKAGYLSTDSHYKSSAAPTMAAAKKKAAAIWSSLARKKHGAAYAKFDLANPKRFSCRICRAYEKSWCPSNGRNAGHICSVVAKPCAG